MHKAVLYLMRRYGSERYPLLVRLTQQEAEQLHLTRNNCFLVLSPSAANSFRAARDRARERARARALDRANYRGRIAR